MGTLKWGILEGGILRSGKSRGSQLLARGGSERKRILREKKKEFLGNVDFEGGGSENERDFVKRGF